jgi:hypothetical protein
MKWNIDYNKSFKCASCGEDNLHHDAVDVYFRKYEDGVEGGLTVRCAEDATLKVISPDGNPSERRNGLVVSFWCEHCDDKSQLAITQHKGTTYYEWRVLASEEQ